MRFKEVDQEDSMGMARKEPNGRAIGARRDVISADIVGRSLCPWIKLIGFTNWLMVVERSSNIRA